MISSPFWFLYDLRFCFSSHLVFITILHHFVCFVKRFFIGLPIFFNLFKKGKAAVP